MIWNFVSKFPRQASFVCRAWKESRDRSRSYQKTSCRLIPRFDTHPRYLLSIPGTTSIVDSNNEIYISHCYGRRISHILSNGELNENSNSHVNTVSIPTWLVHHEGNIFCLDARRSQIRQFQPNGKSKILISFKDDINSFVLLNNSLLVSFSSKEISAFDCKRFDMIPSPFTGKQLRNLKTVNNHLFGVSQNDQELSIEAYTADAQLTGKFSVSNDMRDYAVYEIDRTILFVLSLPNAIELRTAQGVLIEKFERPHGNLVVCLEDRVIYTAENDIFALMFV